MFRYSNNATNLNPTKDDHYFHSACLIKQNKNKKHLSFEKKTHFKYNASFCLFAFGFTRISIYLCFLSVPLIY